METKYHFIKMKGKQVHHSMWFGSQTGKEVESLSIVSDYDLKRFTNGEKDEIRADVVNWTDGELCRVINVKPEKWEYMNEKDKKSFEKILAENNLVWEERERFQYGKTEPVTALYYISKENFMITLNGQEMTYREFKNHKFGEEENVVLSGDNGYSHCWESTTKASDVFDFIDKCFNEDKTKEGREKGFEGAAHLETEIWGWHFGKKGEMQLRTTTKSFRHSEVSDT